MTDPYARPSDPGKRHSVACPGAGACGGQFTANTMAVTARGGPLAALEEGDAVTIDVAARKLRAELPDGELERRLSVWSAPEPRYTSGVLRGVRSARLVGLGGRDHEPRCVGSSRAACRARRRPSRVGCSDGASRARTGDLLGAIQALSQLSDSPESGAV